MHNPQTLVALSVLALSAGGFCHAADATPATVTGRVTAVQPDSNTLTVVTTAGDKLKLRVGAGTKLEHNGRAAKLNSFVVGDPVSVRYENGSDGARALAVHSDATTARTVREKMEAALKAAGKYTYREKEKFQRAMGHVLQDLDGEIHRLEARANEAKGPARRELDREVVKLKEHARQVRKELGKAGPAAEGAWEDIKKGTASALNGLGNAINKAGNWLRDEAR
jgi:hypothetical protein